jgi:hypothetical protein
VASSAFNRHLKKFRQSVGRVSTVRSTIGKIDNCS